MAIRPAHTGQAVSRSPEMTFAANNVSPTLQPKSSKTGARPTMPAAFDPYYTWLGIPPEEQPADFYRLLGLKRFEENRDVISNAADQRLAHIRSFQSGQHMRESQRVLNELSKASGCLLNPRRKAMYDQHLRSSEVSGKQAAELSAPDDGNEFSIRIEPIRGGAASPPRRSKRQTSSSVRSKAISLALGGIAVVAIAAMITILVGRYRHTSEQALSNIVPDVTKSAAASDLQSNSSTDSSPTKNPSTLSNQNKSENTTAGSVVASATQAAVADSESSVADTSTTAPTASSDVGKGQATETSSTPDQQAANTKGQTVAEAAGTPASGETSPAPALPGQPKALRFNGSDRVVLTNSQGLVDLKRPLTVEMWVRFQPGDIGHWLCGDLIIGGKHAAVPPGAVAGWQLFIQQTAAARHRVAVSTRDGYAHDFPVTENRWHHLAFCSDTKVATIYVDGRQTATGPLELLVRTFVPSPIPLQIGSHEHLDSRQQPAGLKGDLKGFRISSTARYTSEFTPSLSLGSDSATEVLLDFEKATAERIADLSGHGRDGQIVGARWVALENWPQAADLASTTPPASVPAPAVPVPVANPTQEPVDAPGAEAIATAAAHVRELFKAELAAAKDAKQKLQFADKLLSLAAESQDDPATRYAMLEQAHKLAIQAHDVRKALAIDTQIARNFRLDELARKVATAKEAADTAKTTVDRKSVAELGISLADDLVEEGRFDEATATIQLSIAQAGRAKETELAKAAREFRDEINQAKRAFTDVQTAKTALEANPDDPEANLRWGRFLCFYQQRWADGLQHLAKSNHEVLAEIARLDLKMPQSGEDQAALAKSWAEAIKAVETAERNSAAFRAWDWSRKANAQLKGLAKVENEKQMKELESQIPSRYRTTLVKNSKPSSNASPFQPPREFVGLLGRVQVAGRDAGILWKYESGLRLTHQQILDVLGQANIPQGRIRIEMVGFLTVLEPTTVNVALDGGSAAGTVTLFVDNQPIGEVGGMRPVSDVYKVDLNPGEHAIRWVLHGDTLGTCSLGFTNSATAQPLAVYHNPQLLTIVRDSPTRARLNVNMLRNQ